MDKTNIGDGKGTFIFDQVTTFPLVYINNSITQRQHIQDDGNYESDRIVNLAAFVQRERHVAQLDKRKGIIAEVISQVVIHVKNTEQIRQDSLPETKEYESLVGRESRGMQAGELRRRRPNLSHRSPTVQIPSSTGMAPVQKTEKNNTRVLQEYKTKKVNKQRRHNCAVNAYRILIIPGVLLTALYVVTRKISKGYSEKLRDSLLRLFTRTMLRLAGVSVDVQGLDKLDALKGKPFIMFCSHKSIIDDYVIRAHVRVFHKGFLYSENYFKLMNLRISFWILKSFDLFFMHYHDDPLGNAREFARAKDYLVSGNALRLNPEGTIVEHDELGKFGGGCGLLAIRTGAYVFPVALINTRTAFEDNGHLLAPANVALIVGDPVSSIGYKESESIQFTELIKGKVRSLVEQYTAAAES